MDKYQSWQFRTVTIGTADSGYGTVLLTTGENPRVLFQLAAWTGTNSASASWAYWIVPATVIAPDSNNQINVTTITNAYPLGSVDTTIDGATIELANQVIPFASKGAGLGGPPCVIPPNCYLLGGPAAGNLNGTVIIQCISAETC